jgi:hypothetical protein
MALFFFFLFFFFSFFLGSWKKQTKNTPQPAQHRVDLVVTSTRTTTGRKHMWQATPSRGAPPVAGFKQQP